MCTPIRPIHPLVWTALAAAVLAFCLPALESRGESKTVRIGVLAKRGSERCLEKWGPTADYLSSENSGYSFKIIPLAYNEVRRSVERSEVDFVLANPAFYIELEVLYGVNRILTMKDFQVGEAQTVFGGVILTRNDRDDIRRPEDLRGKRFMATDELSLGGWLAVWRELLETGVNPYQDFAELQFGHTHDVVVQAVRDGKVEAGSVRTDTLERMALEGKIDLDDFRVVDCYPDKKNRDFQFLVSTRLYPEWPLAKLKHTPTDLAERIAVALLKMPADGVAAQAGRYAGWTVPLNYQSVHECMKELHVGPYVDLGEITLSDIIRQYWAWLIVVVFTFSLAIGTAFYVMKLNRRLKETAGALEAELTERQRVEEKIRRRHVELFHISRLQAIEEMASSLAHELNQPLCSIVSCAQGCLRMIKSNTGETEEILDAVEEVCAQAERAGQVMWRLHRLFSKRELNRSRMDLCNLLKETAEFIEPKTNRRDIDLVLDLQDRDLTVFADSTQIEQVLLNLSVNAIEAMETIPDKKHTLKIQAKHTDENTVQVAIGDTGPGLPKENPDKIFEAFFTTKQIGAGIGLSINRSIVETHGGRLWATSNAEGGATFRFNLPRLDKSEKP